MVVVLASVPRRLVQPLSYFTPLLPLLLCHISALCWEVFEHGSEHHVNKFLVTLNTCWGDAQNRFEKKTENGVGEPQHVLGEFQHVLGEFQHVLALVEHVLRVAPNTC